MSSVSRVSLFALVGAIPAHPVLRALPLLSAFAAMGALSACGGGSSDLIVVSGKAFSQEALNDDANLKAQAKVVERIGKAPVTPGPDVVVAVTGSDEITGLELNSGKTWTFKHAMDVRPSLAGPLVIGQGAGEVFALDAATGQSRWVSKAKGKLIGSGSDGTFTALTAKVPDGYALYILDAQGNLKGDRVTEMPLADPGVASGLVLVPWKALYVTAFEASSGNLLATFITDTETSHVFRVGGAVFAGQGRLVRFDEGIMKARQGGSNLLAPPKELPNVSRRELYVGTEHGDKLQSDAIDFTVLAGRPTDSGPAGFVGDRVYGAYYRLMMGWQGKDGKLAWVHTGKDDLIAAAASKDGVVVIDKSGTVKLLAASNGAVTKTLSLGKPAVSAEASVDNFSVGTGGEAKPLSAQLREAVTLNANELATAQIYLVQQAAAIPDEEATAVLLEVADNERTAASLKEEARTAIALRTNGAQAMIALLARHANFLKDTRTPPVGPMAKALATMKEKKAAQPLLEQLLDPALPNKDLLMTAEGVSALASTEQIPQLKRFIAMYRGSAAGNISLTDACGAIASAIVRLDAEKGKEWVAATAKDSLTDTDVRSMLNKAVDSATSKKKVVEKPKDDEKVDESAPKKKKKVSDDGPEPAGYRKHKEQEAKEKSKRDTDKKPTDGEKPAGSDEDKGVAPASSTKPMN
ncbi:MAG: hypothetical protein NVS3B20_05340 [Polyangiales bacterium]